MADDPIWRAVRFDEDMTVRLYRDRALVATFTYSELAEVRIQGDRPLQACARAAMMGLGTTTEAITQQLRLADHG